jgi:hypothetical protein
MVFKKRIFIFSLCAIFFACKKDKTVDSPTVQITAPTGLQTFSVFDTLTVKANVSDPQGLKSVSIYLSTGDPTPVLPTSLVTITSNNMSFSWLYPLNDIHLAGGQYYITVSASNGTNTTYAYQEIYVDGAPTVKEAVYAITRNGSNTEAWKLDNFMHVSSSFSVSGNYSASDVNSYYQQLYIAASDSGNVNAYSVPLDGGAWSTPGGFSPTPFFTNVYSYGDAAYVSYYGVGNGGYVKYFNHNGVSQAQINVPTGYFPIKTFAWDNYLLVEQKNVSSPLENLVLYYAQSGLGYQQASIPGPMVAMYGMDNDDVFVFGNQPSGTPYLMKYSISGNDFYSPVTLPNAKLLSATQINSQTFLIGFNNGIIYQYTYNPVNFVQYISGVNANRLRYDPVNNQLILATGKIVQEYNCGPTSATLAYSTTPLPDSVMDVEILNNK